MKYYTLKGALVGILVGVILVGIVFFVSGLSSSHYYEGMLLIGGIISIVSGICGAIIGLFYEKEEKARQDAENAKRRQKWASEVKQNALKVNQICSENKLVDNPLTSIIYKSNIQMESIITELTKITELQGKVNSLSEK